MESGRERDRGWKVEQEMIENIGSTNICKTY